MRNNYISYKRTEVIPRAVNEINYSALLRLDKELTIQKEITAL